MGPLLEFDLGLPVALLPVQVDDKAAAANGLHADLTVVRYSDASFIVLREHLVDSPARPSCPICRQILRVDWRGITAAVLCTPECGYSDRLTLQAARGRPTIREHIVAVKAAYEEGYDLGVSLGAAEPRYWGTSEARGLLAQCWFDEVEAVDQQDAAPAVRTHWLRRGAPVCGADPGEPSGRVIDEATTCLACLEVIERAFEVADG